MSNIYANAAAVYTQLGKSLTEGAERSIPGIQLAHYPIADTAFAAALGTLGIPFREPAPYTDDVLLDENGNERGRRVTWWLSDRSGPEKTAHITEWLVGAWDKRQKFESDHPFHPLVSMRAALDARRYWCEVAFGAVPLPMSVPANVKTYSTHSMHAAAVLKACGFRPVAFIGRMFHLEHQHNHVDAAQVVATSMHAEGATPQQWMHRCLMNYSAMLKVAKSAPTIIRERISGDTTLLLTADSTRKTRDKFHGLL